MKEKVKKQEVHLSQFTNISSKADEKTQTHSSKKLIKAVLHSVGLSLGKSDPIPHHTKNDALFTKLLKKAGKSKANYYMQEQPFMQYVTKQTVL